MAPLLALTLGIAIGLIMSAPVGPVNVLCSHRAFRGGFWAGLSAGLGAMLADVVYAAVAVFGVVSVARLIDAYDVIIKLVGGTVLLVYAVQIWRKPPLPADEMGKTGERLPFWPGFASGLGLTLTNPGAILGFLTIFAGLGALAPNPSDPVKAISLVAGVALGATLWWAMIAGLVARYRHALPRLWLIRFNHASAVGLALFAAWLLIRAGLVLLGVVPPTGAF